MSGVPEPLNHCRTQATTGARVVWRMRYVPQPETSAIYVACSPRCHNLVDDNLDRMYPEHWGRLWTYTAEFVQQPAYNADHAFKDDPEATTSSTRGHDHDEAVLQVRRGEGARSVLP
jgi:hypothetical protein